MNKPATNGLKFYIADETLPNKSPAVDVIGPITINVKGTTTNNVQKGTKNVLTTSGIIFLNICSILEATYTAAITGITVDAYPLDGITTGIPQKVIVCPARSTMSG